MQTFVIITLFILLLVCLGLSQTNIIEHYKYKRENLEVKMRQKRKHMYHKRQKRLHRKKGQNAGQFFEDILFKDLKSRMWKGERFYNSVVENVKYKDRTRIQREVDDFAVHHRVGHKRYVVIVECKLSDRRGKAIKQLTITKNHVQREFSDARIFCIYAYGYNFRTKSYKVEWIRGI